MIANKVNYCPLCGTKLEMAQRAGRQRPMCPQCGWVFFPDPKVVVSTLVERNGEVLLIQRSRPPYQGKWALPSGFVDVGEDPAQAAEREVLEETNLQIKVNELLNVISSNIPPKGSQVIIFYRGKIIGGELQAGDDAAQATFFARSELPPLAFKATKDILLGL